MAESRHYDEETLRALAQGALDPELATPARQHVQDCETCAQRLAAVDPLAGETLAHGSRAPANGELLLRAPSRVLEPGSRVSRYILLERLGSGGMGEIYAAYDPQLDRRIALKLMRADVLSAMGTRSSRASLLAEAKALARLNHPNVVAVHDVGEVGEEIFIAMELVEGEVLRDWLAEHRRPPAEILQVFKMAGRGLAAAHAVGLVHRDFKPLNVIVGRDGRVRVVDFGLARAAAAAEAQPVAAAPSTPAAGPGEQTERAISGTPAYMAPEQLRREQTDARTDQFSFAVSLYEALHGTRPFAADSTPASLLPAIERGPAPPPARSAVPGWIHALLARALSFQREARFPSMEALLEALEQDPIARRRQRWRVAGAALAVAAIVAGAVVARSSAQQRCAPRASRWVGIWDDTRRAAVRQAIDRTGKPFARDASDAVERALDRYRVEWLSMHQASCLATLDGTQPRDVLDLRTECLERRLTYVRALVDHLAVADATTVENAARAVEELQPLSDCADEHALRAGAAWPLDPSRRREVEAIRAEVDRAYALYTAGSMDASVDIAAAAAARAEATEYKPLIAEAQGLLAHLRGRRGEFAEGVAAAHRAAAAAQETGQLELVVQAWTEVVHLDATQGKDPSLWSTYAEALLRHLSGDTRKYWAKLRRSQAVMATNARQYQRAVVLARESLAIAEQLPGRGSEVDRSLGYLATTAWYLGDLDTAVTAHVQAAELARRMEGVDHPRRAGHLLNLAGILLERGDWEESLRRGAEAESIYKKGFSDDSPPLRAVVQYRAMALAHLEVERGAPLGAESLERSQIRELEQGGADGSEMDFATATLANILRLQGRCREALPMYQRALDALAPQAAAVDDRWEVEEIRENLGACLLSTGQPARALPQLRESVKWFEESGTRNFLRAEGQFLLAQAQWQTGARDDARAGAATARELLAAVGPRGRKLLPEVDRWIASR
ncbi:MAG TPA: serine/threonine-protein kinase [Myxococcaceae bacterium]|nr:serine/threonine-protein kinase [Myxococcaceae bacterium]